MSRSLGYKFVLFSILIAILMAGCQCQLGGEEIVKKKASVLLLLQVDLREKQIAEPTPDRLEMMKNMGMRVDNLNIQKISIHLTEELNLSQIAELEVMGITLYLDSWTPPVGDHPTGFILADMPIDKLEELAAKDYVVKLDTAEQVAEWHQPQGG